MRVLIGSKFEGKLTDPLPDTRLALESKFPQSYRRQYQIYQNITEQEFDRNGRKKSVLILRYVHCLICTEKFANL